MRAAAPARSTHRYHVGQHRVQQQVRVALQTRDRDARLRRLQQVMQSSPFLVRDVPNTELMKLAAAETADLTQRLRASQIPVKVREVCKIDKDSRGRPAKRGDYKWLMRANDEPDRAERRAIKDLTERAIECRCYAVGTAEKVCLEHVDSMLAGTRLISPSKGDWPKELSKKTSARSLSIMVEKAVVFEVARRKVLAGKRVVAVNAASAYHIGGGFSTGGRHALEESMCVQSTLYNSLLRGSRLAEEAGVTAPDWVQPATRRTGGEWMMHIPDDGAVLSPFVEVFRGGTLDGYPFEDVPVRLEAVVSVAMPNCNDRMSDSPVDAHPDGDQYYAQLKRKWQTVLTTAAEYTKADTLVIPDCGCGVFRNPPEQVGSALGELLREVFFNAFEEIIIAFPGGHNGEIFAEHVSAAFESRPAAQVQSAYRG